MFKLLTCLFSDRSGATAIEYGLIVSLIVIAIMGAISGFAGESVEMWSNINQKTSDAIN